MESRTDSPDKPPHKWRIRIFCPALCVAAETNDAYNNSQPNVAPLALHKGAARLLMLLLVSQQKRWTIAQIGDALWDAEPAQKNNNARKAASRLNAQTAPFYDQGFGPLVARNGSHLSLNRAAFTADWDEAQSLHQTVRRAVIGSPEAHAAWKQIARLCQPEILPQWDEWFLHGPRLRARNFESEALLSLAEADERGGNAEAARQNALRVAETGADDAVRARAEAVIDRIKNHKPAPFVSVSGSARLDAPVSLPFPEYNNSFWGRDTERSNLNTLLENETVRLITLCGPGGVGKTRLLFEWSAAYQAAYQTTDKSEPARRIFLVNLAPLAHADVTGAFVAALGLLPAFIAPLDAAFDFLRDLFRPIVLFDNAEHLLDAPLSEQSGPLQTFLRQLLSAVPGATLVVTSRQPLQLRAETVLPVKPLPVPKDDASGAGSAATLASISLFVDRARRVNPAWGRRGKKENQATVARVVSFLDGLPLALELVAGRALTHSPQKMERDLSDLFRLAVSRVTDGDERHRRLDAAFALSFNGLSPAQKTLYSRLSVFVGGASLDTIGMVCADTNTPLSPETVAHTIEDFVFRNLAELRETPDETSEDDEPEVSDAPDERVYLLETLRAFGAAQMTPDEKAALSEKHADYFFHFAETAVQKFTGPDFAQGFRALTTEYANIRTALSFLTRTAQASRAAYLSALRLARAVGAFCLHDGRIRDGAAACENALSSGPGPKNETATEKAARLDVQIALAWLYDTEHKPEAAMALIQQSLFLADEINAPPAQKAELWRACGHTQRLRGEMSAAESSLQKSVELARQSDNAAQIARSLHAQAHLFFTQGDNETACSLFEESLIYSRKIGYLRRIAVTLGALSGPLNLLNRFDEALQRAHEAVAVQKRLRSPMGIALASRVLASSYLTSGNPNAARPLLVRAREIFVRTGDKTEQAVSCRDFGVLALENRDWGRAYHSFAGGLVLFHAAEARHWTATFLCWCAVACGASEKWQDCVTLWHAGASLSETCGKLDPYFAQKDAPYLKAARDALAEENYHAAQTEGEGLNWNEAVWRAQNLRAPFPNPPSNEK